MVVIVTDAKYRSAVSCARSLKEAGHTVVLTQTKLDSEPKIPAFKTKYANRTCLFDCSVDDYSYKEKLLLLVREYDFPVIFPIGAKTLDMLVTNREIFEKYARFVLPTRASLDAANDKDVVRRACENIGVLTPRTYENQSFPESYPVIVKPKCGEKFGLTAKERYIVAKNSNEYELAYKKMERYGGAPVVQELVDGIGAGVCLLMDKNCKAVSVICHKRLREYPASGGPSACAESFYDEALVKESEKLLASLNFTGFAMVEYKLSKSLSYVLEINPRVWGSFSLTHKANSSFSDDYVKLACGENIEHTLDNYNSKVKMNFILSDIAACFDLLKHGKVGKCFKGLFQIITFRAKDAMYYKKDARVFRSYISLKFGFKGKW